MKRAVCLAILLLLPTLALAAPTSDKQDSTAAAGNAALQPDFIFSICTETRSLGESNADLGVDPGGWLNIYLNNHGRHIDAYAIKDVTLLEETKHGKLIAHTTGAGTIYYMYDPTHGYEGEDRAKFLVEFEGKRYKILVTLKVYAVVALPQDIATCPEDKLIKVTQPSKHPAR